MSKKTYGVPGLTDWTCTFGRGLTRLTVHFTGGVLTDMGMCPATHTTASPMVQHAIEISGEYASGKVVLLDDEPCQGDPSQARIEKRAPDSAAGVPGGAGEPGKAAAGAEEASFATKAEAVEWLWSRSLTWGMTKAAMVKATVADLRSRAADEGIDLKIGTAP